MFEFVFCFFSGSGFPFPLFFKANRITVFILLKFLGYFCLIFPFKMSLENQKSPRCFYNKCETRFDDYLGNSTQTEGAVAAATSNVGQDVKKPKEDLKKCGQCHLASYCSPDCQKKDWKYHKGECSHVKKVLGEIERMERIAIGKKIFINGKPGGVKEPLPKVMAEDFEYHRGCCSTCTDLKMNEMNNEPHFILIRTKFNYAFAMWHMAEKYNSYALYKKFFDYSAELARVAIKGTSDLKNYMVMALMSLGRDQDAYNMIKFWIITFHEKDNETLAKMNNELNPGEWLHLPNQNMKEDLFGLTYSGPPPRPVRGGHSQGTSSLKDFKHNFFMAALVAIKINIILKLEEALRDVKKQVKTIPSNNSIIESNLVKDLKEQREHLDGYVQTLEFHEFLDQIVLQKECPQGAVNHYNYDPVRYFKPESYMHALFGTNSIIQPRIIWTYFNRLFRFKPETRKMIKDAQDSSPTMEKGCSQA